MARLSSFTRNTDAVAQGTPVTVGPEGETFVVLTRGMGDAYADRLWALRRAAAFRYNVNLLPQQSPVTPETLPPSEDDRCQAQALTEKCLMGIDGLTHDDEGKVPVTLDEFNELIKHRENRWLLVLALQAASSVGRVQKQVIEDAGKN
ncbi:hypothetical protein ACMAUO_06165 [Gluconacetobacter sp. Hr-1-5]|uniref:hypothetical protein n=1 Tax=Gluconacetobacter sp. Hr-1-5 TaxID=3395370 RepID=UPI003B52BEB5